MPIGLIIAIGTVLMSPVLWFLVSWICTKIPFAAEFLSKLFWELLGEIPVFKVAAQILENALSYEKPTAGWFIVMYLEMIANSALDALILGFAVFLFKSIFARVTRQGLVTIPREQLATVLGIVAGISLTMGKNVLPDVLAGLFEFLICLGCMLLGIGMMFRRTLTKPHRVRNRGTGIAKMLMEILVDANIAILSVSLTVCSLEGPRIVQETGSIKMWLAWYVISMLLYGVLDTVLLLAAPSIRNAV